MVKIGDILLSIVKLGKKTIFKVNFQNHLCITHVLRVLMYFTLTHLI